MTAYSYGRLLNFAWYQLLWFTAVLGGAPLQPLLAVLIFLHLSLASDRRAELALMLGAAALGYAFDGLLASVGFFTFAGSPGPLPVPAWLIAIWMGFAGTLRYSMAFMAIRPRLMTAAATFFAPLTYLGAERLGAVDFRLGLAPTAVAVALSWAVLTPMLLRLELWTRAPLLPRSPTLPLTKSPEA